MGGSLRIGIVLGAAVALAVIAGACGGEDSPESRDTLPDIVTTTTTTTSTIPPTTRPRTYEIQPGESLSAVAEKFGLNYLDLAKYNDLDNPDSVQAGQVIKLPPATVPGN